MPVIWLNSFRSEQRKRNARFFISLAKIVQFTACNYCYGFWNNKHFASNVNYWIKGVRLLYRFKLSGISCADRLITIDNTSERIICGVLILWSILITIWRMISKILRENSKILGKNVKNHLLNSINKCVSINMDLMKSIISFSSLYLSLSLCVCVSEPKLSRICQFGEKFSVDYELKSWEELFWIDFYVENDIDWIHWQGESFVSLNFTSLSVEMSTHERTNGRTKERQKKMAKRFNLSLICNILWKWSFKLVFILLVLSIS